MSRRVALVAGGVSALVLVLSPAAPSRAQEAPAWEWPARLSSQEVALLCPKRDGALERLERLGPTPEERLAEISVPPAVQAEIRAEIHAFSYRQRQGSAALIRRVRRDRLISEHGVRAVPYLIEVLSSDRYWSARVAAQALGILARGEQASQVRWLAHHYEAPLDLITSFGQGPEHELAGLHRDLHEALEGLLGAAPSPAPQLSAQAPVRQLKREGERAQAAWLEVWVREHARWLEEERARARERRELQRQLDLLRGGVDPASREEPPGSPWEEGIPEDQPSQGRLPSEGPAQGIAAPEEALGKK